MKIIEKLCDMIEDELDDAEKYARCALEKKDEYPQLAETFYKIANEEMVHMGLLHTHVVNLINDYKKTKGDPPEGMKALYDILHRKYTGRAATIKGMLALYKE